MPVILQATLNCNPLSDAMGYPLQLGSIVLNIALAVLWITTLARARAAEQRASHAERSRYGR